MKNSRSWPTSVCLQSPTTNSHAKRRESCSQCQPHCSGRMAGLPRKTGLFLLAYAVSAPWYVVTEAQHLTQNCFTQKQKPKPILKKEISMSYITGVPRATKIFLPSAFKGTWEIRIFAAEDTEGIAYKHVYFAFALECAHKELTMWKDIHFCNLFQTDFRMSLFTIQQ